MDEVLRTVNLPFTYRASNPESYTLHFPQGDVEILLMGAENYSRAAGVSLAWFGIDELDLIEKELAYTSWKMMVSRLTKGNVMQGFTTSTPEGFNFLHQYFVEEVEQSLETSKPITNRRLIRARTQDNPHIDKEYIETMRANYPDKQLDAYLNGEFVNLTSGNVYYCFDRAHNSTDKTLADFNPNQILHVGMDFNVGQMSATISVIEPDNTIYTLEEITDEANTESMIKRLQKMYPRRQIMVYPDSSGKNAAANASTSSITQLKQAGFQCFYNGNNPSVAKERIPAVNARYKNAKGERRAFVNIAKCPTLVKGLEQQGYVNGKPDKSSGLDHCLDAHGYFFAFRFPVKGKSSVMIAG
jgi:hypothetical protein